MPDVQMPSTSSYAPLAMKSLASWVAVAGSQPVATPSSFGRTLMSGIVLEDVLEADVAVGVGRVAGDAAHVVDVARAAELVEQPLGAELGVLDLVVVEVVGVGVGDVGVDRDGLDAGCLASSRAGLRPSGLFGLKTIASTPAAIRSRMSWSWPAASVLRWMVGELGDLARRKRLGLGGADLLLAEAVADAAAVRVADRVRHRRPRSDAARSAARCRRRRRPRRGRARPAACDGAVVAPPPPLHAAPISAIAPRPRPRRALPN